MNHYFEIRILPDPEFTPSLLMNALFNKLHRALVKVGCNDVGVSFPRYNQEKQWLGESIRIHSSFERLEELINLDWLKGMHDHIRVGSICEVPTYAKHAVIRRIQTKSSAERIRRRQKLRHKLSDQQALELIPNSVEKRLHIPFVTMRSGSTEQTFRLFIKQEETVASRHGSFNAYGLSKNATVPLF